MPVGQHAPALRTLCILATGSLWWGGGEGGALHAGLFHAWDANDSSLLNVLMPDGFPIAPQWISPILTAGLTATECLSASESAEIAPVRLHSWTVASTPGIRWGRWGGRGGELRLRGVVIRSPGTDQTLATGGGRPTLVNRHRSRVVGHSPNEGHLHSSTASICDCRLQ